MTLSPVFLELFTTSIETPVIDGMGTGCAFKPHLSAVPAVLLALAGDAAACRWKQAMVWAIFTPHQDHKYVYCNMKGSSDANMQMAGLGFCTYISCWSAAASRGHTCVASV